MSSRSSLAATLDKANGSLLTTVAAIAANVIAPNLEPQIDQYLLGG